MAVELHPELSPAYLIVAAQDLQSGYKKGDIVEVMASGSLWSDWIVPPKFIRVTITDKSKNQVNAYLLTWELRFEHTLLNQNDNGWRYEIAVDSDWIGAITNKAELKQEMADYLDERKTDWSSLWYKSSIFAWDSNSITVDIPKPIEGNPAYEGTDPEWIIKYAPNWNAFLREVRNDFHDKFRDYVELRRYKFAEASVDLVVANMAGAWEGTHTQALNHIVDKLTE